MSFAFKMTPRINLACKLVPVQYREYEYSLSANYATVEGQPPLQLVFKQVLIKKENLKTKYK